MPPPKENAAKSKAGHHGASRIRHATVKVGPNRQAGVNGLVWTDDNLFKFLENPATVMPGNKMTYSGMKDEVDRRDLIAYLRQQSKK
jgi:cytochrome c2